jgi:hypothetical protein
LLQQQHPSTPKKAKTNHVQRGLGTNRARVQEVIETSVLPRDPDEPTYCLCKEVSYGDMVACDNKDCEVEWFHYPCVKLENKPKGAWYCPLCRKGNNSSVMKDK